MLRAGELFATKKAEFEEYKSFRDYIEAAHGIRYHKAMHAAQIYRKLLDLNLPWSELKSIGWTKVRLLLDVVTKENIKQWIANAKAMNYHSLKALVEAEKHYGEADTGQVPKTITTKTFKLHVDQKELVDDVLLKVSEVTGSHVDSVNLEAVFQSYLSGGGMYADVSDAMAYAAKHVDDPLAFVEKQVATLQHLFPQLNIAFEITSKEFRSLSVVHRALARRIRGIPVPIATDMLLELSCEAEWPDRFLQCAGSSRARSHIQAMLTRIHKAYTVGNRPQLRYLIQQYLTSHDALFAASRSAAGKMRGDRRPKETELNAIAETLNAVQGTREVVRLKLIHKGVNTFRPILDFGIENRTLQHLVRSVLHAVAELHPRQFATRGGVPAAIAQVVSLIRAGYIYAREVDIKDFYASFDGNKLVGLVPFQKRVIENVLLAEHLNILPGTLHRILSRVGSADTDHEGAALIEKYLADARRGIPQGSAASTILAEMLLAPLLFQVPTAGEVVAYADNILVLAKSESDADAMTESLGLALKKHPAGHLWPKIKFFRAGGPIDFLGHRLTGHSDQLRVQPTPENREKFERKMKKGLAQLTKSTLPPAARDRLVRDLKSDLSSHASNFRLCDGVKECRQHWLAQISSIKQGGSTMQQSKPSSGKRMVFWPHPDQEEIIMAALDLAKKQVSTRYQTVALEAIAQSYMANGIAFKNWRQALIFQRKQTQDPAMLAQEVSMFLQELCPELTLKTTIAPAAPAPVTDTVNASDMVVVEEALSVEDEDEVADIPSAKISMSPPSAGAQGASLALADTTKPKGNWVKRPKTKTLPT